MIIQDRKELTDRFPWLPSESVRIAAWLSHSENEIGSLEPGKFADLVVLESDPRKVEPRKVLDIKIHQTW